MFRSIGTLLYFSPSFSSFWGLVICGWNPLSAVAYTLQTLADNMADNVILLLFTLFMGVGISFIWRLGGSFALAEAAKRRFKRDVPCASVPGASVCCAP